MSDISTFHVDMNKKGATFETENERLAKPNVEQLASARQKWTKSSRTKESFVKAIPSKYLGSSVRVEKNQLCCIVAKTNLTLLHLLSRYEEKGGDVVRAYQN